MREGWGRIAQQSARTWCAACALLLGCGASGTNDSDAALGSSDLDAALDTGARETEMPDTGTRRDAAASSSGGEGGATADARVSEDASTQPAPDAAHADAATKPTGCDAPGLAWKSAKKTNYESYPAPGSDECVKYHGCDYLGQFQACKNTMPESWVEAHDIAAVYPLTGLSLHRLCLRAGAKTIVVTAIDTCSDSDCSGCCSKNRGSADRLIDLEKYTDQRFGVPDGELEWADLGAGDSRFDGCN